MTDKHTDRHERSMTRRPYTPETVMHRRKVITAMRVGREYTIGDIQRMTELPERVLFQSIGALRLMGLVETQIVSDTRVYRLKPQEAAQ